MLVHGRPDPIDGLFAFPCLVQCESEVQLRIGGGRTQTQSLPARFHRGFRLVFL